MCQGWLMLKNIFIPEKIGSYYIFPKRVIGFEITKHYVFATVTSLKQNDITIEQCLQVPIEQDSKDITARTVDALSKIINIIGTNAVAHVVIPCSQAVFKTLKLPFDEYENIGHVINFEAEPLIPFAINEAIIDFIITKQYPEEKSAEVLIAAVQKQYIQSIVELFKQVPIPLEAIGIDMLSLYGLYATLPSYAHIQDGAVLIDIGAHITKLAYMVNGQLLSIRTLPFGIAHVAKTVAAQTSSNTQDVLQELLQSGLSQDEQNNVAQQALEPFANKVTLTLQSFSGDSVPEKVIKKFFLSGIGATIKGFDLWFAKTFSIPCELFRIVSAPEQHILLKNMSNVPVENNMSCAATIPTFVTEHVNLLQQGVAIADKRSLLKQLIVTSALIILLFSTLSVFSFLQARKFKKEIAASRNETIELLHEWFPSVEQGRFDDMFEEAQKTAEQEEKIWFAFDRSKKHSFLNFLLELSHLDRQGLGLVFERITINQDNGTMTIKAQVKGHEALEPLQNELKQTNLFTYIQPQQNANFNMELHFATGPKEES